MRIVFLTRSLGYGGAERQLVNVARGLAARGHEVHVAVFYADGPLADELAGSDVRVHWLGKRGRWDLLGFAARTLRCLRACRPEVVHPYLIAPNLVALAFRPWLGGVPVVWGVRASNMDFSRYDWLARLTFAVSRRLARYTDLIIANSSAGAAFHVLEGYPRERVVHIPNGIDTERFRPDRAAGAAVRSAWGVAPRARLIGMIGRLDPMKDHPTFLRAAAALGADHADVRFACVGDGPAAYRDALRRQAVELGLGERVIWTGRRGDTDAVLNAFDLLCSSSAFGEGFPNVIAEAMACGVPCVVTDVGDSAEIVGQLGSVVPPREPEQLAAAWRELLDGRRSYPAADLRRRIERQFSLDLLVERTENALSGLRRQR